jgi:hypothetical protein
MFAGLILYAPQARCGSVMGTGIIDMAGGDTLITKNGVPLASGVAMGGCFTITDAEVDGLISGRNFSALTNAFQPLASDDFRTGCTEYYEIPIPGAYRFETIYANITFGDPRNGKTLYTFFGDGGMLFASSNIGLVRHTAIINSGPDYNDISLPGTLLIGTAGTTTYDASMLGGDAATPAATINLSSISVGIPPTLSCDGPYDLTPTSASFSVNYSGEGMLYQSGFWISETAYDPDPYGGMVFGAFGPGGGSGTVTGLTPDTNYSVRAFAANSAGNGYSAVINFRTPLEAPEIAVWQAATWLTDGGAGVDFGSVNVGKNASLIVTIGNGGYSDLTGLGITIDGTDAAMFTVTAHPSAPVSGPGGSTAFTVQFAASDVGIRTAVLHITSNDADENPFDITLTGTGVAPPATFETWLGAAGLTNAAAAPLATPHGDGVANLLKYAFHLNGDGPDRRVLVPATGTQGLPHISHDPASARLRVEFVRRRNAANLVYQVQFRSERQCV